MKLSSLWVFERTMTMWMTCFLLCTNGLADTQTIDPSFVSQIESDWQLQELRLKRRAGDNSSLTEAFKRAEMLATHFQSIHPLPEIDYKKLAEFKNKISQIQDMNREERLELYHQLRWTTRQWAFSNPLLQGKSLVFMKRHRFICQMLHEYLGYFYDYGDIAGGGVFLLDQPGKNPTIKDLIKGRLPRGNYTTLALSFDGNKVYFAFAERAPEKPDFYSPQRRSFHLYGVDLVKDHIQQLTEGLEDDFDPCPTPEGALIFMSTRRGGFGRCHNPWEPLPSYTLHRLDTSTDALTTLSFHETNEWHPFVMNDGRIIYTRWDYVDRSAANFHGLWTSYPDGSNPQVLFGNYTERINACYQPHAIPGSHKILFVAGAHHADVGGSLVLVDPSRISLSSVTGEDNFSSLETLTPEVCFAEANGWPNSYFHSPYPLSEDCYLVSFSFDPLPGMGPKVTKDTQTGIYYFDRFGNLELIYRDPNISSMYPILITKRPTVPQIASVLDANLGDEGEFLLTDVTKGLFPIPQGRSITQLRIFQVLPKSVTHVANQPRLGYANAESARAFLGVVPVEKDGSAYFRAPARKPLYFQAVDADGKAVASMRSVTYLQPGERRGCIGCHEPTGMAAASKPILASLRAPSLIEPGPNGSRPMSFTRLIQPILDQKCVSCHHNSGAKPALVHQTTKDFTKPYENLKPYIRWHEWGGQSISQIATRPGHLGTDESPLIKILNDANHRNRVPLAREDLNRLYLWLDSNAPFYGTYYPEEQLAQKNGKDIPIPKLQ